MTTQTQMRPVDTAPSGDEAMEPSEIDVHEGAWAWIIGTNGKRAGWVDTHNMFADQLYRDHILKTDQANTTVSDDLAPYVFDRYVNGVLMAEGVTVERAPNLPSAMSKAASLAAKGPNREIPVLVLVSARRPTADVTDAEQARQDAADARANFLTMQGSAAQLLDRLVVARRVIRETTCPRPANDRPDEFTAGQCFDCGECGCHVHAVLSQQAPE